MVLCNKKGSSQVLQQEGAVMKIGQVLGFDNANNKLTRLVKTCRAFY